MKWEEWFKVFGLRTLGENHCADTFQLGFTLEELYQAFKNRLFSEIETANNKQYVGKYK
jgi:hypothetical protein